MVHIVQSFDCPNHALIISHDRTEVLDGIGHNAKSECARFYRQSSRVPGGPARAADHDIDGRVDVADDSDETKIIWRAQWAAAQSDGLGVQSDVREHDASAGCAIVCQADKFFSGQDRDSRDVSESGCRRSCSRSRRCRRGRGHLRSGRTRQLENNDRSYDDGRHGRGGGQESPSEEAETTASLTRRGRRARDRSEHILTL